MDTQANATFEEIVDAIHKIQFKDNAIDVEFSIFIRAQYEHDKVIYSIGDKIIHIYNKPQAGE